jgi:hypothetical protein
MKLKSLKKPMLFGISVLWLSIMAVPVGAEVNINVGVGFQLPPIVFSAPPELIVVPDTYVYVVPDVEMDIYFYDGWWWRPYEGRWYRSHYYDRGWDRYSSEPRFYREVPRGWRNDYRNHQWRGQQWNYQRVPHQDVQRNWNGWKRDRYWEKRDHWGVQQPGHQGQQPPQPQQHLGQQQGHQGQQPPQPQQPPSQQPGHQGQQPTVQQPGHQGQQPNAHQSGHQGQQQGKKVIKNNKKEEKVK